MTRHPKVALSLAAPDTDAALDTLRALAPTPALCELRLDLMRSFDLPRLLRESPCALLITCRPPREGGRFAGSEAERLDLLRRASRLGAAWIDVEWDSLETLPRAAGGARVLASRHALDHTPSSWMADYEALRGRADAVKLVGAARRAADVLPALELLARATSPVVALAMGAAGRATRLLAPLFDACLLTYAAADAASVTAPGQLAWAETAPLHRLARRRAPGQAHVHMTADAARAALVDRAREAERRDLLHVPLVTTPGEAAELAAALPRLVPNLALTADAALDLPLPGWLEAPALRHPSAMPAGSAACEAHP